MTDYLAIIENSQSEELESFIFKARNLEAAYELTERFNGPLTRVFIQSISSVWLHHPIRSAHMRVD